LEQSKTSRVVCMAYSMRHGLGVLIAVCVFAMQAHAQIRGVYPLGSTGVNSGVTPQPGFTYVHQFLYYARDQAKDNDGHTLPVTGRNYVLMDINVLAWVSKKKFLGGANFSAAAFLMYAKNGLSTDTNGKISGGGGFADSYYQPVILGWNLDRVAIRAIYSFLAPTGHFAAGASDTVGSGYWTHGPSSGQTFYLKKNKRLVASAYELYEFHSTQEGTNIHPGDTFDVDYSLMGALPTPDSFRLQVGIAGYEQRQLTDKTGPTISETASQARYAVNSLGFAVISAFPKYKASLGVKFFKEFSNRSTFQGYSVQVSGSISFGGNWRLP
jgi:hypothetical protein